MSETKYLYNMQKRCPEQKFVNFANKFSGATIYQIRQKLTPTKNCNNCKKQICKDSQYNKLSQFPTIAQSIILQKKLSSTLICIFAKQIIHNDIIPTGFIIKIKAVFALVIWFLPQKGPPSLNQISLDTGALRKPCAQQILIKMTPKHFNPAEINPKHSNTSWQGNILIIFCLN